MLAKKRLAVPAMRLARSVKPMIFTPLNSTTSPGSHELAVAALLGGHVDDDRAGLERLHHVLAAAGSARCVPGTSAVVMMMSTSAACLRNSAISASMNSLLITLA